MISRTITLFVVWLSVFLIAAPFAFADDPLPEAIISRHLDSMASKEVRAAIKTLMGVGDVRFDTLRAPTFAKGKFSVGRVAFLSETEKMFLGTKFNTPEYPFDEIVYDGKDVGVAYITPGTRSVLGNFLVSHRYLLSQGLLGGILSTGWTLHNPDAKAAKIRNAGTKKIDGRKAYVLSYLIKGGSSLSVKLYFDAETFHHVRSEYEQVISAPIVGDPRESAGQVQTLHQLTEHFSNFKPVRGVTLPHSYRINLLLDGKLTHEYEWRCEFTEFKFNQKFDSATFANING